MPATLKLINKYFWRGYIGPVFAYGIPLLLVLFIGRIIGPEYIIPGAFAIPTLSTLLVFMPQTVFEFKNSSILKRIGATPIKPWIFLISIALFNFVIVASAFLFIFLACFAIFYDSLAGVVEAIPMSPYFRPDFMYMIKHADWGNFIYASVLMMILAISIGLFIASVSRSTLFIQSIGVSLLLIVLFVGPVILPMSMVADIPVIKYVGYLVPLKYSIGLVIESFTTGLKDSIINISGSNIWNVTVPYEVFVIFSSSDNVGSTTIVFETYDKLLNLIMPWLFLLLFSYLTSVTFSWSNRGRVTYKWNTALITFRAIKTRINNKKNAISNSNKRDSKNKNIIEIHNIKKIFKVKGHTVVANNDISFNIERGKNLAILGANGAGKTVLIEMIIGINNPNYGYFKYNLDYTNTFQEKIGVQFQESNYPYGIKAKDIVSFFIDAYKIKISNKELNDLIKRFGITDFYNKNASALSGGQQQRLNLLLSIIHKPEIVFLDELSTGLDIKIRTSIKKFIQTYAKENNITIVIISHDMNEVEFLCEDIVILREGKVVSQSTVKKAVAKYKNLENYMEKYL